MFDRFSREQRSRSESPPLSDSVTSTSSVEFEITEEDVTLASRLVFLSYSLTLAVVAWPAESLFNTKGSGGSIWKFFSEDAESDCIYKCKTCSKCFSSFQALGGHRASHKKPKLSAAAEVKQAIIQEDMSQIRTTTSSSSAEFEITKEDVILTRSLVFFSCTFTVAAISSPAETLFNINGVCGSSWKFPRGGVKSACIYECKTCSKCFPSFQALGGHRASHKKPKLSAAAEVKKAMIQKDKPQIRRTTLSDRITTTDKSNRQGKIHKCSICGSGFSSGQALGGHMRRHKLSSVVFISEIQEMWNKESSPLSLDLTLRTPGCYEEAHSGGTVPPFPPPVLTFQGDRLFVLGDSTPLVHL